MDAETKEVRQFANANFEGEAEKVFEKALNWCVSQSTEEGVCPFCGWVNDIKPRKGTVQDNLKRHMRVKHAASVTVGFLHKDLTALERLAKEEAERDDSLQLSKGGIEVVKNPAFDFLYVPQSLKQKIVARGGKTRWATRANVQRYKDAGCKVVERPGDVTLPTQGSHEDTTLRTNELVLMEVPAAVRERNDEYRKRLINNNLVARKEEMYKQMGENAGQIYNLAIKRGLSKDQARNLARAAERGGINIETGSHLVNR